MEGCIRISGIAGFGGSELKTLTMLAIVALQGIGIIVLAIAYAGNRSEIDAGVRAVFTCKRPRTVSVKEEEEIP